MAPDKPNARPRKPGAEKSVDGSSKPQSGDSEQKSGGAPEAREGPQDGFSPPEDPRTPDSADSEPGDAIPTNPSLLSKLKMAPPPSEQVTTIVTGYSVRKPKADEYFRTHSTWRVDAYIYEREREAGIGKDNYLVDPDLVSSFPAGVLKVRRLVACINQYGVVFVWPIGRVDPTKAQGQTWAESDREIDEHARTRWVRTWANMRASRHEAEEAEGDYGEPLWPKNVTFDTVIDKAFHGLYVDSLEHDVVRALRGKL